MGLQKLKAENQIEALQANLNSNVKNRQLIEKKAREALKERQQRCYELKETTIKKIEAAQQRCEQQHDEKMKLLRKSLSKDRRSACEYQIRQFIDKHREVNEERFSQQSLHMQRK
jgi:RNA-splicing ligase RtcB